MRSEEAIKHMTEIINSSVSEFSTVMLQAAQTGNTLMKQRITETGKDAEGNYFPPYSTKPMLANCSSKYMTQAICNSLTGTKEKRAELKWVTVNGAKLFEIDGGYKEFRNLHGRRIDFVDFVWSGELMGNIQVVSEQGEHKTGRARISTMSDEKNEILSGLTDKKGEILMFSESEINDVSEIIETWLAEKWNE